MLELCQEGAIVAALSGVEMVDVNELKAEPWSGLKSRVVTLNERLLNGAQ